MACILRLERRIASSYPNYSAGNWWLTRRNRTNARWRIRRPPHGSYSDSGHWLYIPWKCPFHRRHIARSYRSKAKQTRKYLLGWRFYQIDKGLLGLRRFYLRKRFSERLYYPV